jgi:2-hydroxychromene-2-carboxylate isomerase
MTQRKLAFYFDYLSPYAYLCWARLPQFCIELDLDLQLRPVLFPGLLNHWGQLGPAEIPPKRAFVFRDCARFAATHGIDLVGPATHPFRPLLPLRLSLPVVAGDKQADVVAAIFTAGWAEGIELSSADALEECLDRAGLPGASLIAAASTDIAKTALREATHEAVETGVFGVPTMVIDGELFWGNDQFPYLRDFVSGQNQPSDKYMEHALNRPRSADRPGKRPC